VGDWTASRPHPVGPPLEQLVARHARLPGEVAAVGHGDRREGDPPTTAAARYQVSMVSPAIPTGLMANKAATRPPCMSIATSMLGCGRRPTDVGTGEQRAVTMGPTGPR
jgi:hypothetical protein